MAVFDATALLYFLEPDASAPLDPSTGRPVQDAKERVDFLIESLEASGDTIVIPTPALSEVMVHADNAGPQYLSILQGTRCFRIEPFDLRAAVELAAITRNAIAAGDLRAGTRATRAKLKFDRQIIAITRVQGQTTIYSDDDDIARLGAALNLEVVPVYALPSPPQDPQGSLTFESENT